MSRPTNEFRILRLLYEAGGQITHHFAIRELGLNRDAYRVLRKALERDGHAKRESGEQRRLVLTASGRKYYERQFGGVGSVSRETELYEPLTELLREASERESVVLNTGALRRRGSWQNPDVVEIVATPRLFDGGAVFSIESYEVKTWGAAWHLAGVYEAASHAAFSHRAHFVLEWATDIEFSHEYLRSYGGHVMEACARFGVGLLVMIPPGKRWRLLPVLMASDTGASELRTHEFARSLLDRRRYAAERAALATVVSGMTSSWSDTEEEDEDE